MYPVALSPDQREAALSAMESTELDILVVGGGVVGAGSALDAATRGLDVGLVEARDYASGTSSRSSKLIHGGLRYLEMLDFALVAEALQERGLLIQRLAPHLVRPVSFIYPLHGRIWERVYAGTGVALYDTLGMLSGNARGLPHHRHLTRKHALRIVPSLRKDSLIGALQYYDAQVDDARHTMFVARTAAAYGAHVASRARVVEFLREGERVCGALVHDQESGRSLRVLARTWNCPRSATSDWVSSVHTPVEFTTCRARTCRVRPLSRSCTTAPQTRSPSRRNSTTRARLATCAP